MYASALHPAVIMCRGSAQPLKPRNAIFGDDKPDKRKATEGANPFSRKPKLARQ